MPFKSLLLALITLLSSYLLRAQTEIKPILAAKNRIGFITNMINKDPMLGFYSEIGLSHEGHIDPMVSVSLHATYLFNQIAQGVALRPEIRFYLSSSPEKIGRGWYVSMGALFSYISGSNLPGVDSRNHVNLYRLGLSMGAGYQHQFKNNFFVNAGGITGLATGMFQVDNSVLPSDLWHSENSTHPVFSNLTAILRVGYAF